MIYNGYYLKLVKSADATADVYFAICADSKVLHYAYADYGDYIRPQAVSCETPDQQTINDMMSDLESTLEITADVILDTNIRISSDIIGWFDV